MSSSFNVIVDTREKSPWDLTSSSIREIKYQKLDTGDYSVEGLEDQLCIERKMSVSEIAQNVNQKRFANELERMLGFRWKYLLIEATFDEVSNFPVLSDLPPNILKRLKVKGPYLVKCLTRMQTKYDLHVIYCGNRSNASWIAQNLMKEAVRITNEEAQA